MSLQANDESFQRGITELIELLLDMVGILGDNVPALTRMLQSLRYLLQGNLLSSPQLMLKLVAAAVSDCIEDEPTRVRLLANVLDCVQLQVRRIPAGDGDLLLQQILALVTDTSFVAQTVVHLFDDFALVVETEAYGKLLEAMQSLLQSEDRKDRTSACFLMHKMRRRFNLTANEDHAILKYLKCSGQQFCTFASILSCLEDREPHLWVKSLGFQLHGLKLMSSHIEDCWLGWLRILCLRLLKEDSVLVLRKTLDYFLNHLNVAQLCRFRLLPEFLVATNRTQLLDPEDANCLKELQAQQFVARGCVEEVLDALVAVPWHSVPLLYWLRTFDKEQVPIVSKELLQMMCSRVRALENWDLRMGAQNRVIDTFEVTLNSLSLRDYMICMEMLFNAGDKCIDHKRLILKINDTDIEAHADCFNKQSYDVFFGSDGDHDDLQFELFRTFMLKIKEVPKAKQAWWRLALFMKRKDKEVMEIYRTVYKVDTSLLRLEEMKLHLLDRLDCQTSEERSFLMSRCLDLFLWTNMESWSQLEDLNNGPAELLRQGTADTLRVLTKLLAAHKNPMKDEDVLPALITRSKHIDDTLNILEYASNNLRGEAYAKCVNQLYKNRKIEGVSLRHYIDLYKHKSFPLNFILKGEISTGDARVEAAYAFHVLNIPEHNAEIRFNAMYACLDCPFLNVSGLCDNLLSLNNELSIKFPSYIEHSEVHRKKIRIATALIFLRSKWTWSNDLWEALLCTNDHLSINLMYECLVAQMLPSFEVLLDQLKLLPTLKPGQQESLLSVANIYVSENLGKLEENNKLQVILTLLPALTMGSSYKPRLLAQQILHRLASECKDRGFQLQVAIPLESSIMASLGDKLDKINNEHRLILREISFEYLNDAYILLYITNGPFDELDEKQDFEEKFKTARDAFKANILPSSVKEELHPNVPYINVGVGQPESGFITTVPISNDKDIIVVASLISKEHNFCKLARTCDELGVKTLILGQKPPSKSSTALNIVQVKPESLTEFLLSKQFEGYKIVGSGSGSSQTINFLGFEFPKKCILLLGQELNGIPSNLIELQDYAVVVPQYCTSANEIGILFISEYHKQHLTEE